MSSKKAEDSIRNAKKYLEDLLSFFGLNIEVHASCEEEVIELSVPSSHMNGFLIGQHGETMRSLQILVGSALKNNDYELTRVNIDIADYKKNRNDRLGEKVEQWVKEIKDSKEPKKLHPMNASDRRIVHKVAGEHEQIETGSEGEGRDRCVVLRFVESKD